jgi:tetratricopeptide (TPR) repeat protein
MDRHESPRDPRLQPGPKDATASDLLRAGLEHHRAGQLAEAEAYYRRALSAAPGFADALHLLGAASLQAGRYAIAVEWIRRAIKEDGRNAVYFFNLGVALQNLGQSGQAADAYRRAIQINPDLVEAHLNLGNSLREQKRFDEAAASYRQALRVGPNYAMASTNLGAVLRDQGKIDEAIEAHREAIRADPEHPEAHNNLGAALYDKGRLDEAIDAYRKAILIRPGFSEACSNLAAALSALRRLDESVTAYRQAIRLKPDFAQAHANLGAVLREQGRFEEAVAAYRQAIQIQPGAAEAHSNLGVTLGDLGRFEEAVVAYRQAIALKPEFAEAHKNLALAERELGRLPEARAALEQAVRLAPRNVKYRRYLGEIMHCGVGEPHLAELERLAEDSASFSVEDRIELHFALAKAYEDVDRRAEAFSQWRDGNALNRGRIVYDEAATLGFLDRIQAAFTSELFRAWPDAGQPSSLPVFILGMPRSGSTLVEQILASHPQVFGAGELTHFGSAVNAIPARLGGSATFPERVAGMSGEHFRDLGARYLAKIKPLAPDAARIADKMPANFIFAGLIHLALPNAPIIHTVRDPVDTCLSCFRQLFASEQNHTYDLAELGRYYRRYEALMAHWRRVLPAGRILDVRYEDVVADLEGQARRIVAHCGLEWDSRCLDFHLTRRTVRTASAVQVRQPLYDSAIGRWKAHESFLAPLLKELGSDPRT